MKNFISIFITLMLLSSCNNNPCNCITPSNGGNGSVEIKMGSENGLDVFDAIDKAWASLDLETVKSYISDDAVMKFADGKVAVGGDEFVEMIQQEVEQWGEAEYVWTTDYKFSLATTSDNDDSTNVDQGDWVNAQFTQELETPVDGNIRNVYYEFYHIIDGKVVSWSQFKRGEKE